MTADPLEADRALAAKWRDLSKEARRALLSRITDGLWWTSREAALELRRCGLALKAGVSYHGDDNPMMPTTDGERLSIYARAFGAVP